MLQMFTLSPGERAGVSGSANPTEYSRLKHKKIMSSTAPNLNIHPPLPKKRDFRIGILGSGFIVNDCHLVSYRKAGFNPVAIASRSRENAAKVATRHAIPKVFDTCEQLLADPEIEVLDIAVPPNAQLALIKAACERKTVKGILAQKPLGMNYAEALEAVECCEQAGITLAVNQNMRYDQSVRAAKTLLENGAIGESVFASIDMRGVPHFMPWQEELGWVTLRIMSIHHIDCLRYWFGNPEGIYCSTRTDPRTKFPHTDGICTYILEYANGLRCVVIDDIWTGPAKEGCPADIGIKWRIEGTNGLAIGDIGWCKDPYTSPSTIRYASKGDQEFHEPRWTESWFPDAFAGTMSQLLIALETGKEPAISGRDNLKTMALVDAAYQSALQFRSITVDEIERIGSGRPVLPEKKPPGLLARMFSPPPGPFGSGSKQLSDFTPRAQQVLALARKEADRFNHNFVGTEHLLLGLIKLGQGTAFNVLQKMGLELETVRSEIEKQVGIGSEQKPVGNIPYTPRVKKILAFAAREAQDLNHTYVGTEHILLGILREGDGVAARMLKSLDITVEETRKEILKELDPNKNP
jgi:predicted dehydrogenase